MIHSSVKPCPSYGKAHGPCYDCTCTEAAISSGCNDLALELQRSAIDCTVEQTGGFTMLVFVRSLTGPSYIQACDEGIDFMRDEDDECPVHLTPVELESIDLRTPKGILQAAQVVRENLYRLD